MDDKLVLDIIDDENAINSEAIEELSNGKGENE